MTLLVMLIAALLDRWVAAPRVWIARVARPWAEFCSSQLTEWPKLQAALVLLPPPLLLALLLYLLSSMHPLFAGLGSLLVLWLCLDLGTLGGQIRDRIRALAETPGTDDEAALLPHLPMLALDAVVGVGVWFLLLGPVGVLSYRLLAIYAAEPDGGISRGVSQIACRLYGLMAWLPAQVMLAAYAIVGRFDEARDAWRHHPDSGIRVSAGLLQTVACAAQGLPENQMDTVENLQDGWRLIWRQVVFLITVAAILTLAGVLP
ncbi:MAG: hypothetical protein J4A00_01670 [Gammaproteobacteria bacterium]|nr:hypothetical protein [Gammaproteobacteria bacterium]